MEQLEARQAHNLEGRWFESSPRYQIKRSHYHIMKDNSSRWFFAVIVAAILAVAAFLFWLLCIRATTNGLPEFYKSKLAETVIK